MRPLPLTATTRFGLGPKPGEIDAIAGDPVYYVREQCFAPNAALIAGEGLMDRDTSYAEYERVQRPVQRLNREMRRLDRDEAAKLSPERDAAADARREVVRKIASEETSARFQHGVTTDHPFVERLVLFWSNHFAIDRAKTVPMRFISGLYEREAIRPHVLGYFEDMLAAATTHPAMLIYLDNDKSVGPNSRAGRRRGSARVNENLARELLELHTVGVGGGYTQKDVGELALALSGWIGGFSNRRRNVVFEERWHEYGPRTIMGVTYDTEGAGQIHEILPDLARHPSTARFIAGKFARHFVGDRATDTLIAELEDAFLVTGGDLRELALTLVESDEAWAAEPVKMVPPYDYAVACGRALQATDVPANHVMRSMRVLAQDIWSPPSPAGWPDDDNAFLGGDALLERVDFAQFMAERFATMDDVPSFARDLLGDTIDPFLAEAIDRAEDRTQALTLLLMSPPFQRR